MEITKKMLKNLRVKRLLSTLLVLAMVLSTVPANAWQVFAAGTVRVRAHFINSKNWEAVHVYSADGTGWSPFYTSTWPGDELSKDSLGYYTFEVTKSSSSQINYVFNDGTGNDANKTTDIVISPQILAADSDGIVDVWIYGDSSVSYTAPTGGPSVNGNQVTFTYNNASASNVYVAGSMNGWSTTAAKMTKSSGQFKYTMTVEPGIYEYKFVVDSTTWIADPSNPLTTGGNGNSVLVVPGMVPASLTVKKDSTITLPATLTYIDKAGEFEKEVTYTSSTSGITVNGTTAKVASTYSGDGFTLNAKTADGKTTTLTVNFYNPGDITVKVHYDRSDNAESAWNVWAWSDNQGGVVCEFDLVNGEYVATYTIAAENVPFINSLNYIIRKGNWEAQEETRTIDLTKVISGTVHSYVKTSGSVSNDYSDAVYGTKINDVSYNRATNQIVVKVSELIANPKSVFAVKKSDGTKIEITDVSKSSTTYYLSLGEDLSTTDKVMGAYKLSYDGNDYFVTMPNIYDTDEFEDLYTYDGDDLGATWTESKTTFKVWAPTAEAVKVALYSTGSDKEENSLKLGTYSMTKGEQGVWSVDIKGDLNGVYYTYLTTVGGQVEESCDPYARTTGVNGERSMVINLDSTNPVGWDSDVSPNKDMAYTDAVIYELHVRDLSIDAESGVRDLWKGKFLGLTQKGTTNSKGQPTGLDHMKDLGVTHVHLLPSYDFGSIDETMTEEEKAQDPSKQFAWGYDPVNYNVPEGSYSTNPYDGAVRVAEMKEMVQTLHENNINVIMDVVYNHVQDAGTFGFNEIVPDYFSRMNADGTYANGSGCGNETASERAMVRKYMVDSVKYWADEYHIDGFRFDLVGLIDAETINQIVDEVHKTHPYVIFYGEGWNMPTAVKPSDTPMATQNNAGLTPLFAYFSDTFRDFVKGKNDEVTWGYIQCAREGDQEGTLIDCFKAQTWWIPNPTQVINYASCHDNYTLMDKINATKGSSSFSDRAKMNNLAAAIYITSEGIPLIHAGEEMLRTKVDKDGHIIHNSYNSPDYINSLKWANLDNATYQQVRDYYAGLVEFRKNHAALRLTTATAVKNNVKEIYIEDNVVMFDIKGKNSIPSEVADEIVVIFNSNESAKSFSLYDYQISNGTWSICVNDKAAGTDVLGTVTNGYVTVPAISALILVKGQTVDNNSVYKNCEVEETGRVYVEYVDKKGKVLATSTTSGKIGQAYITTPKVFDNYTLKETPSNASGKYTYKDIFVTYVYTDEVEEKLNVTCEAGANQVKVSWNALSNATKYQVCSYVGGKYTVQVNNYTETCYTVTGLVGGTKYGFLVRAYENGKWTSYSTADLVYATPSGSSEVKPVVSVTAGNNQVTVKWNAVSGATKYQVCSYVGGKYTVQINNYTGTSYVVTGLAGGTKYGLLVRAYVNGKWTSYSTADLVYATPSGSSEVKPVVSVTAGNNQVTVKWNAVSGATKYQVCSYVGGKYTVQVNTYTGTSYTVTGLAGGTKYGFLVRAYGNGKWTTYSTADLVYATPIYSTEEKPVVTVVAGNGQVTVKWNALSGATKYQVCSHVGGKYTVQINNYVGTSYTVTGLTSGTKYGFLVRAYVNGRWTTYSLNDLVYVTPK